MPTEEYRLPVEDAIATIAELLGRDDVRTIVVEDVDGEPLVEVPGTATPGGGAHQVIEQFQEYEGGGTEVTLVVETGEPSEGIPPRGGILEEPPESPGEGEPTPHP